MESMEINYEDNKQIKRLLQRVIKENDYTYKEVARLLDTKEQYLRAILNKKNINCDDMKKILDIVGYDLVIEFKPQDALERVANKASKTTLDTKDTNNTDTLDVLLKQINDDEATNTDIKIGYCGNGMVDDWMDRNGYTINHKLYKEGKMDSKLLDKLSKELFIAINFGRTKEYVDKKILVKIDNSK